MLGAFPYFFTAVTSAILVILPSVRNPSSLQVLLKKILVSAISKIPNSGTSFFLINKKILGCRASDCIKYLSLCFVCIGLMSASLYLLVRRLVTKEVYITICLTVVASATIVVLPILGPLASLFRMVALGTAVTKNRLLYHIFNQIPYLWIRNVLWYEKYLRYNAIIPG